MSACTAGRASRLAGFSLWVTYSRRPAFSPRVTSSPPATSIDDGVPVGAGRHRP
ncbi:MAG: hypothetical protein WAU77_00590 [Solirubrobacteraceae bacterium]